MGTSRWGVTLSVSSFVLSHRDSVYQHQLSTSSKTDREKNEIKSKRPGGEKQDGREKDEEDSRS